MIAALGAFVPYFSLYLKESLGFTGVQVGMAFALAPLVGMVAQPLWGHVADRTGSRVRVLTLLSTGTALGYASLTLPHRFGTVLGCTALLAFFSTAQVPMAVAVSLSVLQRHGGRIAFGRVRVWGTLGFLVTVVGAPPLLRATAAFAHSSERRSFHSIFALSAALSALAALFARGLPDPPVQPHARMRRGEQRWLLEHTPYLRVLVVSFIAYSFLQGPLALFPVYVHARGGTTATISYMWICMLAMETTLMFVWGGVDRRLGSRLAIALGVFACGARWALCAFCSDLAWVYPLQMLHGAMVVSLQVSAPLLVESLVPERLRASGQAGLNMLGPGIGGIVSNMLAGWVLDARGIDTVMLLGGCGGLLLGLGAPWILPSRAAARLEVASPQQAS